MSIPDNMCAAAVRAARAACLLIIGFQDRNNIFENMVDISIRKGFLKNEQLIDLIVHVFPSLSDIKHMVTNRLSH
jgi:hypothetical protein